MELLNVLGERIGEEIGEVAFVVIVLGSSSMILYYFLTIHRPLDFWPFHVLDILCFSVVYQDLGSYQDIILIFLIESCAIQCISLRLATMKITWFTVL